MAPVTATNVGMAPQVIDSPELKTLMDTLNAIEMKEGAEIMKIMESLVETLEPFSTAWRFEEQVRFLYYSVWLPILCINMCICMVLLIIKCIHVGGLVRLDTRIECHGCLHLLPLGNVSPFTLDSSRSKRR
jgi:hypothetical protein